MKYKLRELLQRHDPDLATALERSHDIAHNEIFPAMPLSGDSLNSYPHIRNLEKYLETILPCDDSLFDPNSKIHLSKFELYSILMAILFHDIGRIDDDEYHGSFSKDKILDNYSHYAIPSVDFAEAIGAICEYHKPLIKNEKFKDVLLDAEKGYIRIQPLGALLFLVDCMDDTINRLSFLENKQENNYVQAKSAFRQIIRAVRYEIEAESIIISFDDRKITELRRISNYEPYIKQKEIASKKEGDEYYTKNKKPLKHNIELIIKTLEDGYDNYLRHHLKLKTLRKTSKNLEAEILVAGGFAKYIYHKHSRKNKSENKRKYNFLITTDMNDTENIFTVLKILNKNVFGKDDPNSPERKMLQVFSLIMNGVRINYEPAWSLQEEDLSQLNKDLNDLFESISIEIPDITSIKEVIRLYALLKACRKRSWKYIGANDTKYGSDWDKKFDEIISKVGESLQGFPAGICIAVALNEIKTNKKILLEKIKPFLLQIGIRCSDWLVFYDGHLYNGNGREYFEPIFSTRYLIQIAESMWRLSTQIYGKKYFSYETLAAAALEPNVLKIKMAVRRINALMEDKGILPFTYDKNGWMWNIHEKNEYTDSDGNNIKSENGKYSIIDVYKIVKKLKEFEEYGDLCRIK